MLTIAHEHFVPTLMPEHGGTLLWFYTLPTGHPMAASFDCAICKAPLTNVGSGVVPIDAIRDRKLREAIAPCEHCVGMTVYVPANDDGSGILRQDSAHVNCTHGSDCLPSSICVDQTCACCQLSLAVLLAEHTLLMLPTDTTVAAAVKARLVQIGAFTAPAPPPGPAPA